MASVATGGPRAAPNGTDPDRAAGGVTPDAAGRLASLDWRRLLVVELALLAACGLLALAWWLLGHVAHTILLGLLGAIVALALEPVVTWVQRWARHRGVAAAIVYLGLIAIAGGGLALVAAPFIRQVDDLLRDLPRYAEALRALAPFLEERLSLVGVPVAADELSTRASALLLESGTAWLGGTLALARGLTGAVVDAVVVLVVSLYMVVDAERIRGALLALVPAARRPEAFRAEAALGRIVGSYLRGQLVLAVTIGVLAGGGAAAFGLPYPILIGVVAGVFELVPMVGGTLGALPALLLALQQPFPTVLWVALYFAAIQQLENHVLVPRVSGQSVGLHPLGAIFALMAGLELAGVLGALLAVPAAGVGWALVRTVHRYVWQEPRDP